ncbi:MAG: PQ-loop repeat-containing protein [Syntrophotaleaceae bacterium]
MPQIIKVLQTRSSGDLSLWMLLIIFIGGLFYTTYAIQVGNPVFAMNGLATTNTTILLLLKLRYR